jgi:tetratricopeptide (TPR) repeat protein
VDGQQKQGEQYNCETCGKPLTFISAYNAWYCYPCQKYGIVRSPQYQAAQAAAPGYGQTATAQAGYDSYGATAASGRTGAAPASSAAQARGATSKCKECGAPLLASGECNHCRAKETIIAAEARMETAAAGGVEIRKVEQLVREARNGLEEGNFGEARQSAEKAFTLVSELEGQFNKAKEQVAEAEGLLGALRSRGVDVSQSDSLIQLSQSFLKTGNYEKAAAYAKKATKTANEAQARQAAEKAMGEKPPMPPAVAVPVDTVVTVTVAAEMPRVVVLAPRPGEAKSPAVSPAPAATVIKLEAPSDAAASEGTKDPEYLAAEKEINDVGAELEKREKGGENVAHARNLLKLALSFLRGGSYEKATRYARKVQNVMQEKKEE